MAEIREGLWDCGQCGALGVAGGTLACTQCGAPRPPEVVFYLPEDTPSVQSPEHITRALAGADWVCSHCQAHNIAPTSHCHTCGNAYSEVDDISLPQREYHSQPKPSGLPVSPVPPSHVPQATPLPTSGGPFRRLLGGVGWGVLYLAELITFVVVLTLAWRGIIERGEELPLGGIWSAHIHNEEQILPLVTRLQRLEMEVVLEVVGYRWARVVEMEDKVLREVLGERPPPGVSIQRQEQVEVGEEQVADGFDTATREVQVQVGTSTSTREIPTQVQTGTEQYVCGQVDLGNGFFQDKMCERPVYTTVNTPIQVEEPRFETRTETYQVPRTRSQRIYQTRYVWLEPSWGPGTSLTEVGEGRTPHWPSIPPSPTRRERARVETYWVTVRGVDGQLVEREVSFSQWLSFPEEGGKVRVQIGLLSPLVPDLQEISP